MTRLSVNLNKVAVLRNSRGGSVPDVVEAARVCVASGCQGITVHPRPDARHIRAEDVRALARFLADETSGIEFNIEGNPFAPPRSGYPGLLDLVAAVRPAQCTLVPDGDGQLTSDHGFDLERDRLRLQPVIQELKQSGCRVSLFVDAGIDDLSLARAIGADCVELYTGPYALAWAAGAPSDELRRCATTAAAASRAGLLVNAGHDLDQRNLGALLNQVPGIEEVSIGHALINDALYAGLPATVRSYLSIIERDSSSREH